MKKTIYFTVLLAFAMGFQSALAQDATTPPASPPVSVSSEVPAASAVPETNAVNPSNATPAPALNDAQKAAALSAMKDAVAQAKANIEADPYGVEVSKPKIIKAAAQRGAQVQYMGDHNGFSGWIIMEQGAPAYVYVSQDEKTVFRGLMFDEVGKPITIEQLAEAQLRNPEFFGMTADEAQAQNAGLNNNNVPAAAASTGDRKPSQVMYDALGVSNFFTIGSTAANAPVLYVFVDPDCPHCKDLLRDIDKDYLQTQKLQMRVIPIGILGEASSAKAAYLLSQPDAGDQLMAQVYGKKDIPVVPNVTLDGQQLNVDLFKMWRFDGTPILIFKDKNGTVMLVRGAPKDMKKTFDQIAPGAAQ